MKNTQNMNAVRKQAILLNPAEIQRMKFLGLSFDEFLAQSELE